MDMLPHKKLRQCNDEIVVFNSFQLPVISYFMVMITDVISNGLVGPL